MKRPAKEISDDEWKKSLGEMNEADFAALKEGLVGESIDLEQQEKLGRLLSAASSDMKVAEEDAPPLPDSVRARFEAAKNEALASEAAAEAELESSIYSQPRRYRPEAEKKSFFSSLFGPIGLGIAGAAAAVAVGVYVKNSSAPDSGAMTLAANSASVLTPGEITGFAEPIFTWKTDNGGAVDIEIIETGTGRVIGSMKRVFSPLRYSSLLGEGGLSGNSEYEVRILSDGEALASQEFRTRDSLERSPFPPENLDAIIRRCEELIADSRPADAWMLWGELTSSQKADPRMQELKTKILGAIAA